MITRALLASHAALAAAVRLDGTGRAAAVRDTVYHLHVPKTAGGSFNMDADQILRQQGLKLASREGCYAWQEGRPRIRGTAVLLREPRAHVLSQYNFCTRDPLIPFWRDAVRRRDAVRPEGLPTMPGTFEQWLQEWRALQGSAWHGDFTPPASLLSRWNQSVESGFRKWRMATWSMPPISPEPTALKQTDWPQLCGGGTIFHNSLIPFQCYAPLSLQAQRLSCQRPMDYTKPPDVKLAIKNMQASWFVGLGEAYQASICLFSYKINGGLPRFCDCRDAERWASFQSHNRHRFHPGAKNLTDYPADVLQIVDQLTTADRLLYEAARERFVREVREMERVHQTKLFCRGEEQALRL